MCRETLDNGAAQTILYRLLEHLIRLTSSCEGQLVTKKLLSTLVVFFLRFPSQWSHSIRHVAACFSKGEVVPLDRPCQLSPLDTVRSQMSGDQVTAALWFAAMLAEEVGKTDSGSIKQSVSAAASRNAVVVSEKKLTTGVLATSTMRL